MNQSPPSMLYDVAIIYPTEVDFLTAQSRVEARRVVPLAPLHTSRLPVD